MTSPTATAPRVPARDRLLRAASELFYEDGINATGVERVASQAQVTKATLYNNFRSKDELIAEYLSLGLTAATAWMEQINRDEPTPQRRLSAMFEQLADDVRLGRFHGCPFASAAVEVPQSKAAMVQVRKHRAMQLEQISQMVGGEESKAELILALYDGAMIAMKSGAGADTIGRARDASIQLLDTPR
ncbi:TetR/AcrR family transcriptional regulator [Microbacterium sp. R86528]|uniref:TetR/AcrR family transcriptional regulator n=1 Tax=Microbacterium sp. R86528 TaxID=3093864 RepID=UPI0037C8F698